MSFWSRFGYSVSESAAVPVPCEVMWNLVRDFERYPEFCSGVQAVEPLPDERGFTVETLRIGAEFRRRLVVGSKENEYVDSHVTIIQLDNDDGNFPRSFSIYADDFAQRLSCRITWTVQPSKDGNDECELTIFSSILPKRCCLCLGGGRLCVPVWRFPALSSELLRRDLQDFSRAAVAAFDKNLNE